MNRIRKIIRENLKEATEIGPDGKWSGKMSIEHDMDSIKSKLEEALENEYYGQILPRQEFGDFSLEYGGEDLHWVNSDETVSIDVDLFSEYQFALRLTLFKMVEYGEEGEYDVGEWRDIKTKAIPLDPSIMNADTEDILSTYIAELKKFIQEIQ